MKTATEIATAVRSGQLKAVDVARDALDRIQTRDPGIQAVTRVLEARALAEAAEVDTQIAAGSDPGPLAGVPYGVKDLFDVAGLPTTAGSQLLRSAAPARADADAIRLFRKAGAVLVATLNMDEFAYGFATVNAFHGTTRNPHDPLRLAGGSSGGSAAVVAGGMLPLALGSDTNGSIRIPAALCGLYGFKPSHGALPMGGVFPFAESFDDIGPFAVSLDDMRLALGVLMQGQWVDRPARRIGLLGGWFSRNVSDEMRAGLAMVARALDAVDVSLPHVSAARSAAFVVTAMEGGALHLSALRNDAHLFDPATRDRLLAGALMPRPAYDEAKRFLRRFADEAAKLFERFDVLIAPTTGTVAPLVEAPFVDVDGRTMPARAHLGIFTQPLSAIGLAALSVPLKRPGRLPLGIQLVAAPGREAALLMLAQKLESIGLIGCDLPEEGI